MKVEKERQAIMTITKYSYGINTGANVNNNVIDKYKAWEAEEIRADLDTRRSDLISVCMNYDKNIKNCVIWEKLKL